MELITIIIFLLKFTYFYNQILTVASWTHLPQTSINYKHQYDLYYSKLKILILKIHIKIHLFTVTFYVLPAKTTQFVNYVKNIHVPNEGWEASALITHCQLIFWRNGLE